MLGSSLLRTYFSAQCSNQNNTTSFQVNQMQRKTWRKENNPNPHILFHKAQAIELDLKWNHATLFCIIETVKTNSPYFLKRKIRNIVFQNFATYNLLLFHWLISVTFDLYLFVIFMLPNPCLYIDERECFG